MITNNRVLSGYERISWLFDQSRCFHFALAAEISGTATVQQWRSALDAVQRRHPLLSVGINGTDLYKPFFQHVPGMQIPLRVVDGNSLERWESELEAEMANPFQSNQVPLVRAVLIQQDQRVQFILAAHHAISDGISFSFLMRDLLNALNGETLEALPMPASLDTFSAIKKNPSPGSGQPTNISFVQKKQQSTPTLTHLRLSQELTNQLVVRARQEGTTVHGALCAALSITEWKGADRPEAKPVTILSPVSVRKTFGVTDDCVAFFITKMVAFKPDQDLSFWELARFAKRELADAKTVEAITADMVAQEQYFSDQDAVGAAQIAEVAFNYDFVLTNIGTVNYDTSFGPFKLESMYGPLILNGIKGGTTLSVVTVNGSLQLTSISRDAVNIPLDVLKEVLEASLQSVPELAD
jgi:Condensation domain